MRSLLRIAVAFIAAPAAAAAQIDLPQDVTDGFYVTVEEIRANSDKIFDALAGPEGGPIPRGEFVERDLPDSLADSQPEGEMLSRLFDVLDKDGDGEVTRAEWDRRIGADLDFADENGDGRITLGELANARKNLGMGEALRMIF